MPTDDEEKNEVPGVSGDFFKGISIAIVLEIVVAALILMWLVGCQTRLPNVEFDEQQCRLLRERGNNTTLLCRRPNSGTAIIARVVGIKRRDKCGVWLWW